MFNFCSLYSGSSGNSLLVESENTKLLIDAGVSSKKIETALTNLNIDPASIDGILITHEHTDHVQGLGTFAKKFDLPVYVNQKTLDAMSKQKEKISEKNIKNIRIEEKFEIGDMQIKPFAIPHDAANPCGFNIFKDNKKISIATDIGHMTNGILKNLEDSIFVLLESNYDPEVLKFSRYPYILKSRIAGPNGHLPKESNFPELAYKTVVDEIISNSNYNENSLKLSVASRDIPGTRCNFENDIENKTLV